MKVIEYTILVSIVIGFVILLLLLAYAIKMSSIEFCGLETRGYCESDGDCMITGCNQEVCQSIYEPEVVTECIWKDCYKNPGYECRCVEGECKWILPVMDLHLGFFVKKD